MSDYLLRDAAPFGPEVWAQVDDVVGQVAKQRLVARRAISLFGPLGAGALAVPVSKLAGEAPFKVGERELLHFQSLHQDLVLTWDDLVSAGEMGLPLDLSAVGAAADALCRLEDELLFAGLRGAKGITTAALGDWETASDGAFKAVAAALAKLTSAGLYGPYVLVTSTELYAKLQQVMADTGRLEMAHVKDLIGGHIFFSPALKAKEAFLIANAPYNLDIAVAQDMVAAYLGNDGLDHSLRIMEKLVLRVKRPGAICVMK